MRNQEHVPPIPKITQNRDDCKNKKIGDIKEDVVKGQKSLAKINEKGWTDQSEATTTKNLDPTVEGLEDSLKQRVEALGEDPACEEQKENLKSLLDECSTISSRSYRCNVYTLLDQHIAVEFWEAYKDSIEKEPEATMASNPQDIQH